ncbi:response regulator [Vibrio parahaemolyticus 10290]|nr:response regulator [Vibrio parahaemolyticus 10290]
MCLNRLRKSCTMNQQPVALTDGEFDLLWVLALMPRKPCRVNGSPKRYAGLSTTVQIEPLTTAS